MGVVVGDFPFQALFSLKNITEKSNVFCCSGDIVIGALRVLRVNYYLSSKDPD